MFIIILHKNITKQAKPIVSHVQKFAALFCKQLLCTAI